MGALLPAWAWWVAAGLLCLSAEILLPGVFLVWIGAAAIGAGLAVLVWGLGFVPAAVVFLVLLAAGVALSLRWRRARHHAAVNAPETGLAGRIATLLEAGPAGARVRLGDSEWPARLLAPAEAGQPVRVEGVKGTVLLVRPVDGGEPAA